MVDFARDIQPLFERSCVGCHGGKRPKGGFTLDSREALLKGGQSGEPAVVPGDAEASPLYRQVRGMVEDLEMPPLSRRVKYPALSGEEIDRLRAWINAGAPWMSAKPEPVSAPRSVFRTLNGVKIHYREWGNPNNPPLVLLHPGFLNSHVWDTFAPALADRFWVIAPDARGMGESEWSGSYDPDVFLEDLRALIEELGLRRVVLCGNSMGGTMAFMFAGLHPENVQRIITVDTGPGEKSTEGAPTASGASAPKRTGPPPIPSGPFGSVEEAAAQVPKAYGPAFIRAMAEQNLKPCGENRWCWKFNHQGTAGAYERSVRDPRKWPLWRAVKCPTLVLRGERSPALSTQTAEQMIAENKHASLVVIPNAGHFIPLEAPVQFEAEVRKWLGL
jgi:pimeloyl-ACP methyl ester carboxylesterase